MNRNSILHWSYRDFHEFPEELIDHSETLEEIYLKENFIPEMPAWLFEFVHLKFIQLSGNLLQKIPDEIIFLENLEHLDVSKNHLTELPHQIALLKKLKYLNVNDNKISVLNEEIGFMKSLETLYFCNNCLTQIPLALAASTSLVELYLNDNNLAEIPTKVMAMKTLRAFEAERCSLEYLPGIVGDNLTHIRIFNNPRLTHYPTIYEKFLRLHYDYWSENVVSADLLMIFLPDESKRTIIPRGIRTIRCDNTPSSLYEYSLRGLYHNRQFYDAICSRMTTDCLPLKIFQSVQHGPICNCGNIDCDVPLFTECHFSLMKKNQSPSHIIFSNMFCSRNCMAKWHREYSAKYHPIDWTNYG